MLLAKTFHSSTFKLALIAIGVFGIIVCAIFSYVYLSTASYIRSRSDRAIIADYASLLEAYHRAGRDGVKAAIQQRVADKQFKDSVYLLADSSFAFLSGNLKTWPSSVPGSNEWKEFRAQEWMSNTAGPTLLRARLETLPNDDHLLVGRDITDLDDYTNRIKLALISSVVLIFVLAIVASITVTRRTVGRIEAINATSQAIMQSGLDKRIPLRGTNDEWDRVAENLNLMLDRIETLMEEVKHVSDNVAHDLRTPLTRMRGRLEKAYHSPRDRKRDQSLIDETIADLDAVLRIFGSITRLAQIETKAQKTAFRPVNLAAIASEVVELYDPAAEEKGTHLTIVGDPSSHVTGDRDLIFDAISNLVDNAIKHGRAAGRVTVENRNVNGEAVISISDDGPGIPRDEYENVFKRFYRLEKSRFTPGNGLGLSLVAAVVRLHGARIEMLDNMPGLKVRIWFPTAMN